MPADDPSSWTLTRLADHLKATDHRSLRELAPRAAAYARRIRDVHGGQHPELERVAAATAELAQGLQAHLQHEEDDVFPALRRTEEARRHGRPAASDDAAAIVRSLDDLRADHERFVAILDEILDLTMGYALPFDACATYDLAYRTTQELDTVLRGHVHLEDDLLLPKAQALLTDGTTQPA